jgi:hypothetical protein
MESASTIDAGSADATGSHDAAPTDSAQPDHAATDGPVDAGPACDRTRPFAAPVAVTELNVATAQGGARLTADMLRIVFHGSSNGDPPKLLESQRTSPTGVFDPPTLLAGLATADGGAAEEAAYPTLDANGHTIYFESNRGARVQIWWAARLDVGSPFTSPAVVAGLDDPTNTGQPYLTGGDAIYFISRHNQVPVSKGGTDIYSGTVTGAGSVTAAFVQPAELETATSDSSPTVSADGREAFFSRSMSEDGGFSTTPRIWTATRGFGETTWSNIGPAANIGGESSSDLATWLSPDRCTLYLSSDRDGTFKIYRASRPQ